VELVHQVDAFRSSCETLRRSGPVGLVLTMGALHEGHVSLMHLARKYASKVVATVFVNPTQFGPTEDLAKYPRDLDNDARLCREAGVDVLFAPSAPEMYPSGAQTKVRVGALAEGLCGAFRPGHFEGVCTVVTKFFAACGPCVAIFGEKDYQQLKVIERVVSDLLLPVAVVGAPVVRESDGLAMSSRNRYLSSEDRARAVSLFSALNASSSAYAKGERRASVLTECANAALHAVDIVEYASIVHGETLLPYESVVDSAARLLIAARVGSTRLIDNCSLATPGF
jgi:pantoate--beta-alanine ligase